MNFNLTKAIRVCYYVLFFVTPLLFSLKTSEIFEFNKMMLIYLVTTIIVALYCLQMVLTNNKRILLNWFYGLLIFFLASQILSTIFSIDVHTSIFGYYSRLNGGLISIIAYLLLFFVFVQILEKKHLERILLVSLIGSLFVILWGIPGKFGADPTCFVYLHEFTNRCWTENFNPGIRMFSTLGQPNWLGAYMGIHFFIGIYFLIRNFFNSVENSHPRVIGDPDSGQARLADAMSKRARMTVDSRMRGNDNETTTTRLMRNLMNRHVLQYVLYLFFNILTIIFTQSRSSQLAVLTAFIIGVIFVAINLAKKHIRKMLVLSLIGIIFFTSFALFLNKNSIQSFFQLPKEHTAITDSFEIRKIVWKGAIDLGNKYPWFGSGTETFAYAYYFTRPLSHNLTSEWDFIYNKAHNEYLNYLATTGYAGLTSYLLMIVGTVILFYFSIKDKKNGHNDSLLLLSIFLGYITILITNFFGFSISIIQIFFYLIPAFFVVYSSNKADNEATLNLKAWQSLSFSKKMVLLIIVFLGVSGGLYVYRYYVADMHYAKAQVYLSQDEYSPATEELYTALGNRYEHVYEDKLSSALAGMAFMKSFGADDKAVRNVISFSKNHNLNTIKQSPYNINYLRTQAKNYYLYYQVTNDTKDLQKSIDASEKVIMIAPTDAQSYYQLALYYWIAGNEVKKGKEQYLVRAKTNIIKVLNFRPNYIEAQELQREMDAK